MSLIDDILRNLGLAEEEIPKGSYLASQSRKVLASLPFPLVLCDKTLLILDATPAFTRLFKLSEAFLKGKSLLQILGGHAKIVNGLGEKRIEDLPQVMGERNPKVLVGNFPRLGPRHFHFFTRRIPPHHIIVFQDVTAERELKEKIEKSRSELLAVFDGTDDPIVMIDNNLRIRRINEAMLKVLGATSYEGFIGKACYYKLHGRHDVCPGCTAGKSFATGRKTQRMGLLERRPQADEFTYQVTCYPLKDGSGQVTAIAESYRDLTEMRRVEEELHESERSRLVESLAAGVAHEVRNPLAVIRSTAQYCLGESGGNQDMKESLQTIVRSSEAANRVLSALLDFARPKEIDIRRQPLRPILEEGLKLIKGRAKLQKVRTVKVVSTRLPLLSLDKNRFLQAYMNLLTNSLDAMPQGGTLTIEARPQDGPKGCRIIVRDTGRGIPAEMLHQVMRPFYTTKKDGVGLGLPIAEGIIRSHGGRLAYRSREGKGTQATVFLPVKGRVPIAFGEAKNKIYSRR